MVTMAVRVRRRSLLTVLGAVVLVMAGAIFFGNPPKAAAVFLRRAAEVKCAAPEEGAAWLRQQGWTTPEISLNGLVYWFA